MGCVADGGFLLVRRKGERNGLIMKIDEDFLIPGRFRTKNFTHHLRIRLVIGRDHEILDKKFAMCTCLWYVY